MKSLSVSILLIFLMLNIQAQEIDPLDEQVLPPVQEASPQEGRKKLSEIGLPEVVRQAFSESEYQGMAITKVFELRDEALDDIFNITQGPKPNMLYEIHVANANRIDIIYFTRDGTRYDVAKKV